MKEEIENLTGSVAAIRTEFKHKFRLPIIITYSVILFVYNWDILFYLIFEKNTALNKILYVKSYFFTEHGERIWKPILLASLYSILFPFLQTVINQIVQYFKRYNNNLTRKEELDTAMHNFNVQQQLTGKQSLQQLQNRIDQLVLEKDNLISTNNNLIAQLKTESTELLDSNSILNSEYDKTAKELFNEINNLDNEEKSTFLELINFIENYSDTFSTSTLASKTSYPHHAEKIEEVLTKYRMIEPTRNGYLRISMFGAKFIKFFKSRYIK